MRVLRFTCGLALSAALAGIALSRTAAAVDRLPCAAPQAISQFDAPLNGFVRAIERTREIRIVAIGSSSTEGTGASSKQKAFPARFDFEMDRLFPGKDFQVANLGKGGELAEEMMARLVGDVIPMQPALVVLQTGVNDANQGVELAAFEKILVAGLAALKAAGIEAVLVDPQFYPRPATVPRYEDYIAVMHRVAKAHGVPVFRRYAIMKHLVASGQFSVDALLWRDKFHLNDVSYGCLAELMASAMAAHVRQRATPEMVAQGRTPPPATSAGDGQSINF